jgi:DSF synthase
MTSDSDPGCSAPSGAIPLRPLTRFRDEPPGHRSASVAAARRDGGPIRAPSPQAIVARQRFTDLDVVLSEGDRAFWCFMNPRERPSFTPQLLADLASMRRLIGRLFASTPPGEPAPLDYFVLASRAAGVFLLGGDLVLFAEKIRAQDREGLREYAQACVTASYANYTGYGHEVITIALIQGDALGGGLEAPLSCDLLIAERQARFGLPEVLFNLFPGVGAYSFLSRRIGPAKAEEMILGGRLYTASEMHALGVIDVLVDEGAGEQAVRDHIARYRSRHRARSAIYNVRRRVNPVPLQELRDIADLWVDTALRMTEQDLRKMGRMATGQARARARADGAPAARAAGD